MHDTDTIEIPEFLQPGTRTIIGSYVFHEPEIIRFARQFDPQIFHTDAKAAKKSMLGGLCASGWHTASIWMKLQRKAVSDQVAKLQAAGKPIPEFGPSPGMKNLKWHRPVFVGDTITYANTACALRRSNSKPQWWIFENYSEGINQKSQLIIDFKSTVFVKFTN